MHDLKTLSLQSTDDSRFIRRSSQIYNGSDDERGRWGTSAASPMLASDTVDTLAGASHNVESESCRCKSSPIGMVTVGIHELAHSFISASQLLIHTIRQESRYPFH